MSNFKFHFHYLKFALFEHSEQIEPSDVVQSTVYGSIKNIVALNMCTFWLCEQCTKHHGNFAFTLVHDCFICRTEISVEFKY